MSEEKQKAPRRKPRVGDERITLVHGATPPSQFLLSEPVYEVLKALIMSGDGFDLHLVGASLRYGATSRPPQWRARASLARHVERKAVILSRGRPMERLVRIQQVKTPANARVFMGGTGLEPVTPSLSSWCSPN